MSVFRILPNRLVENRLGRQRYVVLAFDLTVRICIHGGSLQGLESLIQISRDDDYEAHLGMRRTNLRSVGHVEAYVCFGNIAAISIVQVF